MAPDTDPVDPPNTFRVRILDPAGGFASPVEEVEVLFGMATTRTTPTGALVRLPQYGDRAILAFSAGQQANPALKRYRYPITLAPVVEVTVRPAAPPQPEPPPVLSMAISFWDATPGAGLVHPLTGSIQWDDPSLPRTEGVVQDNGQILFVFPDPAFPYGWHVSCDIEAGQAIDRTPRPYHFDITTANQLNITVPLSHVDLPRLHVRDKWLQPEGQPYWHAAMCSDFDALNKHRHGVNIDPVLQQRADIGFNVLRVWSAYDLANIGTCVPDDALYAAIPAFLDRCARFGLYVELTAFTGPYPYFATDDAFVAHWDRLVAACAGKTNVWLELVNEYDNAPNAGVPFDRLAQPPAPLLASHGSAIQDAGPKEPFWSHSGYHPDRANEWQRKPGHNTMEWADHSGRPCVANECIRFPDEENNPTKAFDAAAGAALLCAGACFHSVHGKNSTLWDADELANARAWVDGIRSVDLDCQNYPYVHLFDREDPEPWSEGDVMRSYARGPYIVDIRY